VTAVCPGSKQVLGGGWHATTLPAKGSLFIPLEIIADYPLTPHSWTAIFPPLGGDGYMATVFAICIG
jgi:hypothetical protein